MAILPWVIVFGFIAVANTSGSKAHAHATIDGEHGAGDELGGG
jgi:hypothetical protein